MPQSLSVVLPVSNAQDSLQRTVDDILEVVAELTDDFEVVIVDDASQDLSEELACQLGHEYPQIRVLRHRQSQGLKQAIQTGLQVCTGDVIFVKDDSSPIRASDLRSLWDMRTDDQLLMAQARDQVQPEPKPLSPDLIQRLMQWGAALESASEKKHGGIQMIRRQAVERLADVRVDEFPKADEQEIRSDASEHAPQQRRISRLEQISRRMPPKPIPAGGDYDPYL